MRARTPAGFTLIELLVVIAIISILSAILFPVYSRTRERAHQAQCMSNLRQLAVAFMMYADDNDGFYPGGYDYDNIEYHADWDPWQWTLAFEATLPYYNEPDILNCPTGPEFDFGEGLDRRIVNVAYNEYLYFGGWHSEAALNRAPGKLTRIAILGDCRFPGVFNDWTDDEYAPLEAAPGMARIQYANDEGEPRHNGSNFAFGDGHVERVDVRKFVHDEEAGLQWPIVNPENRRPF